MRNVLRRRPSASMIVAITALVFAASGTAAAATHMFSGDKLIKKHSLSGNRLRNHTITGTQVNLNKLGKVPSAKNADHATTANSATTATSATNATNATTAGSAGSAPIAKLTYVSNSAPVPSSATAAIPVTATCPAGTNVVGGGAQVADETSGAYGNDSYPAGKTGWTANFFSGSTDTTGTVTAICAPAAATG
ncbi:MAG TPA: hypothetical protein VMD09_16895 [Solirubrobacteraceae bacterium]|nr:hypothetical protein [Solirubrobacteraceae bacterium]